MKFTNQKIYEYGQKLSIFSNCNIKLPVRINFYLQKNIQLIQQAFQEIEQARLSIGAQFGTVNEERNGYDISPENIAAANKELNDLLNLEQEIPIHIFNLSDFDNIELTYQQLSAIMFMIEE